MIKYFIVQNFPLSSINDLFQSRIVRSFGNEPKPSKNWFRKSGAWYLGEHTSCDVWNPCGKTYLRQSYRAGLCFETRIPCSKQVVIVPCFTCTRCLRLLYNTGALCKVCTSCDNETRKCFDSPVTRECTTFIRAVFN